MAAATKAAQDEIAAQEAALQSFEDAEREALAINEDEKRELQVAKTQERYDALIEQAKKFGRDTAALEDARTRAIAQITKTGEEDTGEIVEQGEKFKTDTLLKFTALGIGIATEGSNAAKALGIAQAIISTYVGAADVLKTEHEEKLALAVGEEKSARERLAKIQRDLEDDPNSHTQAEVDAAKVDIDRTVKKVYELTDNPSTISGAE